MSSAILPFAVLVLCLMTGNGINAVCRIEEEGCNEHVTCCEGLRCDNREGGNGFCQSSKSIAPSHTESNKPAKLSKPSKPTNHATASATISHKVRMTYASTEDRDGKLQALLTRWKSILAQPEIGRTATDIKLIKDTETSRGHLVTYEVVYQKANKKNLKIPVSQATAAVNDSLGQDPIAGVSVVVASSRSLMAFDVLE